MVTSDKRASNLGWDGGTKLTKINFSIDDNRQKYALNHPSICILIIKSLKSTRILHVIMV